MRGRGVVVRRLVGGLRVPVVHAPERRARRSVEPCCYAGRPPRPPGGPRDPIPATPLSHPYWGAGPRARRRRPAAAAAPDWNAVADVETVEIVTNNEDGTTKRDHDLARRAWTARATSAPAARAGKPTSSATRASCCGSRATSTRCAPSSSRTRRCASASSRPSATSTASRTPFIAFFRSAHPKIMHLVATLGARASRSLACPTPLNKFSRRITQPKSQGASQASSSRTGLTEADMDKAAGRHRQRLVRGQPLQHAPRPTWRRA